MIRTEVKIREVIEPWSVVTLTTGEKIRVRHIFTHVFRVCDDQGAPASDASGMPIYEFQTSPVVIFDPKKMLDA